MDRLSRILGVWVVGCLVVGIGMLVAKYPVGTEQWTDERAFFVRLGWIVIGLGIAGLVGELLVVLASFRRTPTISAPVAALDRTEDSEELIQARARVAELEAQDALEQKRMLGSALQNRATYTRGMRSDFEVPKDSFVGRLPAPDVWARVMAFDHETAELLRRDTSDEPDLLRAYNEPIESIAVSDQDWRTNVATFLETKATRLEKIARRLQGLP